MGLPFLLYCKRTRSPEYKTSVESLSYIRLSYSLEANWRISGWSSKRCSCYWIWTV